MPYEREPIKSIGDVSEFCEIAAANGWSERVMRNRFKVCISAHATKDEQDVLFGFFEGWVDCNRFYSQRISRYNNGGSGSGRKSRNQTPLKEREGNSIPVHSFPKIRF